MPPDGAAAPRHAETIDDGWSSEEVANCKNFADALSITEMAAVLKCDYRDFRNKVTEICCSCRPPKSS
jgi:hypothetical protein